MNLNCTTGPATRPCTSLWSQGAYRSRSFSFSSTTVPASCPATAKSTASVVSTISRRARSRDANPLSRLTEELAQRSREMHVGASVVAALSNRPTCIQKLTHTDPLQLAGRGAYTRARPDSPHVSRSIKAPKSYTTELRAGGCPKPTGRRPTDPQPTIATARASPVDSNALNGPTRLTATTPRRVRTGSSQLNLRSDGQRLRPSAPTARRCSRWLTRRSAPFDSDATLDFDLSPASLSFRRQQLSIGALARSTLLDNLFPRHKGCRTPRSARPQSTGGV